MVIPAYVQTGILYNEEATSRRGPLSLYPSLYMDADEIKSLRRTD